MRFYRFCEISEVVGGKKLKSSFVRSVFLNSWWLNEGFSIPTLLDLDFSHRPVFECFNSKKDQVKSMTSGKNTSHTVDGEKTCTSWDLVVYLPLFTRFYTSQVVVWDFFHQQYHKRLDIWRLLMGKKPPYHAILGPEPLPTRSVTPAGPSLVSRWVFFYGKDSSLGWRCWFFGWVAQQHIWELLVVFFWGLAANLFPVLTLSSSIGKPLRRVIFLILIWCCGRKCMNEWISLSQNNKSHTHNVFSSFFVHWQLRPHWQSS